MESRRLPTQEEVESYLTDRRNWERWGRDDEVGAVNLITPQKCIEAAGLVRSGRRLSLSRDFPKTADAVDRQDVIRGLREIEACIGEVAVA